MLEVVPCDPSGREYTEQDDMFKDSPDELVGSDLHFIVKLISARGLNARYTDIYCKYSIFNDTEETKTSVISDTSNPDYNHSKMYSFTPVTKQILEYLHDGFFVVQVWGKQQTRRSAALFAKGKTTKEMLTVDRDIMARSSKVHGGKVPVDPQKQSIVVELLLLKKQQARLQQRVDGTKKLIERAELLQRNKIPVHVLKEVFNAPTPEGTDKALALLEGK